MSNEFNDIEAIFSQLYKAEQNDSVKDEKNDKCYPYDKCEMCWSHGSFVGKIIPDSKNIPLRRIDFGYLGRLPFPKDDGNGTYNRTINAIASSEYRCELTEEQKKLNDSFIAAIDKNIELCENLDMKPFYKKIPRITVFYMAVRRFINLENNKDDYEVPEVTVMIHRSFNFMKKVTEAIENRSASLEDRGWIRDYFNRDVTNCSKLVSVKTSRPAVGYDVVVDFLELPKSSFDVSQELIDRCSDLNDEIININSFNEEEIKNALEIITKLNSDMESNVLNTMHDYVPPTAE